MKVGLREFQWLGQSRTASECSRSLDGEWGRWDLNWDLSDSKVHVLSLKLSYSPILEITITQGRGHSDLCRNTQALRKLKSGFFAAASMTQWLVSSVRATTQQKVFALRQGQKCFIDFIQDVYTWDQMTPVMEALKGSPALNERGPYFHLWDSVISSERWFVETVYKQMTSPIELPLPMPVMCVEAKSPGTWWRGEAGRENRLTQNRQIGKPTSGWREWPLIRELRHEFWERKMVTHHWETRESK